jgi:glycosyltransferase involved in cell wall biosynthesis
VKRQVDSLIEAGLRCDVLFVRGFESNLAYLRAALKFLVDSIWDRRYQLVHVHAGETALAARFWLTSPVVVTYWGSDLLGIPRADASISVAKRIRRTVQRGHARVVSQTITQSRRMESVLPATVRRRNLVIPSGTDSNLFRPIDRSRAREQLGWHPSEPVALFAANPKVPVKRHWLAEEACDRAAREVAGLRLHVAAGVAPDMMPTLMSAADCLLLTSSSEGSPNVVKEAIQCDLPVVTTRVGDVDEVLSGVEPSWICASNPDELASALTECVQEPRRSNGRRASIWLRSESIARQHLDLYEQLAPGSAVPC